MELALWGRVCKNIISVDKNFFSSWHESILDLENIKGTSEGVSVEKLSNNVEEDENASKDNDKENSKKRVLGDITNTVMDDSSKVRCSLFIEICRSMVENKVFFSLSFHSNCSLIFSFNPAEHVL